MIQGEGRLRGRLVAVTRNPGFRLVRSRTSDEPSASGTLGVDTAVAPSRSSCAARRTAARSPRSAPPN